ncbi:MAG: hypothetical protein QM736_15900 [Vicinamibacterales bacterium]
MLPASNTRSTHSLEELLLALGQSPSIGTASVRRVALLTRLFPNAQFAPMRGNLDTRLRKLDEGEHDALVLAAAGLRRLGFASRISFTLPLSACVPAPGQGIIAIEIRTDDTRARQAVDAITDRVAAQALEVERGVVDALGGGCQTPIGALATPIRRRSVRARCRRDRARWQSPAEERSCTDIAPTHARLVCARRTSCWRREPGRILEEARRAQAQNERNSP